MPSGQEAAAQHAGTRGTRPACRTPGSAWAGMSSLKNSGVGCSPPPGGQAARAPGREPGSSRLASWRVPGLPVPPARRPPCQGKTDKAPPCMRWRGLARPRRAKLTGCPASLAPRAARQCQVPVQGPVSRLLPRSRGRPPRWCPFPTVKHFYWLHQRERKALRPINSGFFAIHTVPTECGRLSAPDSGYPLDYSQLVHKSPNVIQESPGPVVAL